MSQHPDSTIFLLPFLGCFCLWCFSPFKCRHCWKKRGVVTMLQPSAARLVQPNTDIAPFKGLILIGATHTINGYTQMNESIRWPFAKPFKAIVKWIVIIWEFRWSWHSEKGNINFFFFYFFQKTWNQRRRIEELWEEKNKRSGRSVKKDISGNTEMSVRVKLHCDLHACKGKLFTVARSYTSPHCCHWSKQPECFTDDPGLFYSTLRCAQLWVPCGDVCHDGSNPRSLLFSGNLPS